MRIEIVSSLANVAVAQWNALVQDNNPFLRHEFLSALEQHGCVGEEFGWLPCHIVIYDESSQLIGAMPLYEKHNSWGEFVFDHAWVNAYKRHNMPYYPKLISAIPYTPASGQRLLALQGQEQQVYPLLLKAVLQFVDELKFSSFHCLFPVAEHQRFLQDNELFTRHDCQFHWRNFSYQSFDDFLATLSSKKRKNIRQERRKVEKAGIQLRVLDGHSATEQDWANFAHFYASIYDRKWGFPALNQPFFMQVAQTLPEQIVLVLADNQAGECIAGSLMFRSDTRLFGRHWGCTEYWDCLHFEACYYQGIEYCIEHGLEVFEPGAQGEHKVSRGFIPTLTQSSHWINDEPFRAPIKQHTLYEQRAIADYMGSVFEHLPYRADFIECHQLGKK